MPFLPLFWAGSSPLILPGSTGGWNLVPPPNATDIQLYNWIVQFWLAARERAWAVGGLHFPGTSFVWASGIVASMTNNGDGTWTISDPNANGGAGYDVDRWFGFTAPPDTP